MITALAAAKAYGAAQQAAGVASQSSAVQAGSEGGMGGGFADMLKNVMHDAVSTTKNAETQMANQIQGKADLVDVVTAISSAQTSLQTVLAVRDQVISAYQEIMRMQI
jgi:flagellar hook-basal body complex protein FliE